MDYRRTADGALNVSEIGVGTYTVAGVYGKTDFTDFGRVLRAAFDMGVTFFDTAPIYGNAEDLVGEALGDVRRQIVLSTKVSAGAGGELPCSHDNVVASCEHSLRRLKTDYIDLYQIHFDDGKTEVAEIIQALEHLKASGKILAYGIGHVCFERAAEYVGQGAVSTLMGELNVLSTTYYEKMLPLMAAGGPDYVGFSLTGRGILSGKLTGRQDLEAKDIRHMDAVFRGEKLRSALRISKMLESIAGRIGATGTQVAIRWALSRPGVVTGLVGPSSTEHLEENIKACELTIPKHEADELETFLEQEHEELAKRLRVEILDVLAERTADLDAMNLLIYAIEGLAELQLAPEDELVSHVKTILGMMRQGVPDVEVLNAIRQDLGNLVGPAGGTD
jgi:aryl-alcohol dehydrogenase-like predicted oxidoreductase